jgi:hypothetical protein
MFVSYEAASRAVSLMADVADINRPSEFTRIALAGVA